MYQALSRFITLQAKLGGVPGNEASEEQLCLSQVVIVQYLVITTTINNLITQHAC